MGWGGNLRERPGDGEPREVGDVLTGGSSVGRWDERRTARSGRGAGRLALAALRSRRGLVAAALLALLGVLAAGTLRLGDNPARDDAVRDGCRAVVAHREAVTGAQWAAALADLSGATKALRRTPGRDARAVRAYASAVLGAPTDGSGQLLIPAARACARIGAPALRRQVADLLPP